MILGARKLNSSFTVIDMGVEMINVCRLECRIFRALRPFLGQRLASSVADKIGNFVLRVIGRPVTRPRG